MAIANSMLVALPDLNIDNGCHFRRLAFLVSESVLNKVDTGRGSSARIDQDAR